MSTALARPMSTAEFLAWEEREELRYEFDGLRAVAMTGGTTGHEIIGNTLRALLRERLQGGPCRVWGPTVKIAVAGRIRYPDAFVNCVPTARSLTVVPEPVVVFEVLSPATSRTDRLDKLREYQGTASIQRYVILEQDSIGAIVYVRHGDLWLASTAVAGDVLELPEIAVSLNLVEVYSDLDMTEPTDAG